MVGRPEVSNSRYGCILLQVWFNLSAEGTEANIHDIYAFRKFKGINFAEEQVPYGGSDGH